MPLEVGAVGIFCEAAGGHTVAATEQPVRSGFGQHFEDLRTAHRGSPTRGVRPSKVRIFFEEKRIV